MNSIELLNDGFIRIAFPPLRRPQPEIADRGTLRLGSGSITAAFLWGR